MSRHVGTWRHRNCSGQEAGRPWPEYLHLRPVEVPADAIDLSVVSRVVEATKEVPFIALVLKVDMPMVRELVSLEEIHGAIARSGHGDGRSHGRNARRVLSPAGSARLP